MHKLNTYGNWEDNDIFWTNELINCSKDKKLKKNHKVDINKVRYTHDLISNKTQYKKLTNVD